MTIDMKALARYGATARLAELDSERAAILGAFPELRRASKRQRRARRQRSSAEAAAAVSDTARSPAEAPARTSGWSAAQRKAVSDRMKKYWAGRRAGKKR